LDGQPSGRVDPSAEHPGHGRGSFHTGEERLHHCGGTVCVLTEGVGPAGDHDQHGRRVGGQHGVDQTDLQPRQAQVGRVAALTGGAVADEQQGDVGQGGDANGFRDPGGGTAGNLDTPGAVDGGLRVLGLNLLPDRGDEQTRAAFGVAVQHVVGEGVAAHQGQRVVGARTQHGDPGPTAQAQRERGAVIGQQHHRPLGDGAGQPPVVGAVEVHTGQVPDPAAHQIVHVTGRGRGEHIGHRRGLRRGTAVVLAEPHRAELGDLLLQGHGRQQRLHAVVHGQGPIAPGRV
jgi:hypothetical protein